METGYIDNPVDPRDYWLDELDPRPIAGYPDEYRIAEMKFEPQGAWPFCVAMAGSKIAEYHLRQMGHPDRQFSVPHLFFNSGGTKVGTYFRAVLDTMKNQGMIPEATLPMPIDLWDTNGFEQLAQLSRSYPGEYKIMGYVRVLPNRDSMKTALLRYGPLLVGVHAGGGYWNARPMRPKDFTGGYKPDNHGIVIGGYKPNGDWITSESLQPTANFDGWHALHAEYPFFNVYALMVFPENYKQIVEDKRREFKECLNRYGQPVNYMKQVQAENEIVEEIRKFKDPTALTIYGRFKDTYVNAAVYGGYSITYWKYLRKQSGDILNDIWHWKRTQTHLFNFDKMRKEQ